MIFETVFDLLDYFRSHDLPLDSNTTAGQQQTGSGPGSGVLASLIAPVNGGQQINNNGNALSDYVVGEWFFSGGFQTKKVVKTRFSQKGWPPQHASSPRRNRQHQEPVDPHQFVSYGGAVRLRTRSLERLAVQLSLRASQEQQQQTPGEISAPNDLASNATQQQEAQQQLWALPRAENAYQMV